MDGRQIERLSWEGPQLAPARTPVRYWWSDGPPPGGEPGCYLFTIRTSGKPKVRIGEVDVFGVIRDADAGSYARRNRTDVIDRRVIGQHLGPLPAPSCR